MPKTQQNTDNRTRIVVSVLAPRGERAAFDSVLAAVEGAGITSSVTAQCAERANLERSAGSLLDALRSVSDSADDTGCDGVFVVDGSVIAKVRALVQTHDKAPVDGKLAQPKDRALLPPSAR